MPPIAICIPARDEADELPHLFAALERLERGSDDIVHVCLQLDGCSDASAPLADAYRSRSALRVTVGVAAPSLANAGRARHRAMTLGQTALGDDAGLLLTTDADSVPSPDWLRAMAAALSHADVVAGRIVRRVTRPSALQDRIEAYYDRLFELRRRLDPVPWEAPFTHHHVGGANMGIRMDAYRALGGFAPLSSGEDARLFDDAGRAGWRVRRDAGSVVHTSDRRDGRASGGLALALRAGDEAGPDAIRVAHPDDTAWQYRMHATTRAAFDAGRLDCAADALGLTFDHVRGVARDCPNGEAFAMRIVPEPPAGMRVVPLPVAEACLARFVQRRRAA